MATRDTNSGFTKKTRDRIEASGMLERLIDHALNDSGEDLMTPSQVATALALIKKVVPDLKQTDHTGDVSHTITFKKPEWLKS